MQKSRAAKQTNGFIYRIHDRRAEITRIAVWSRVRSQGLYADLSIDSGERMSQIMGLGLGRKRSMNKMILLRRLRLRLSAETTWTIWPYGGICDKTAAGTNTPRDGVRQTGTQTGAVRGEKQRDACCRLLSLMPNGWQIVFYYRSGRNVARCDDPSAKRSKP